ncbi:MAG: hypothetical protein STHCBS139747_002952 [Sporothrix thermara]
MTSSSSSSFTPLESLLLFQSILKHGVEPEAFARIASVLQANSFIRSDDRYNAERLTADSLRGLFLEEVGADKVDASALPPLIERLYVRYRDHIVGAIREDERRIEKVQGEIRLLEQQAAGGGGRGARAAEARAAEAKAAAGRQLHNSINSINSTNSINSFNSINIINTNNNSSSSSSSSSTNNNLQRKHHPSSERTQASLEVQPPHDRRPSQPRCSVARDDTGPPSSQPGSTAATAAASAASATTATATTTTTTTAAAAAATATAAAATTATATATADASQQQQQQQQWW